MPAPTKNFTSVADSAIDANSPLTAGLMEDLRDNDEHLEEWLGKDYTAAANHDHDGVNSAAIAGLSGGKHMALRTWYEDTNPVEYVQPASGWEFSTAVALAWTLSATTHGMFIKHSSQSLAVDLNGVMDANQMDTFGYGFVNLEVGSSTLRASNTVSQLLAMANMTSCIRIGSYTGDGTASQVVAVPGMANALEALIIFPDSSHTGSEDVVIRTISMTSGDSRGTMDGTRYTDAIKNFVELVAGATQGFTVSSNNVVNESGETYYFIAFSSGSLNGERVAVESYTGTASDGITGGITLDFAPHLAIVVRADTTATQQPVLKTRQMGLYTFDMDGGNPALDKVEQLTATGFILGTHADVNGAAGTYDVIFLKTGNWNHF